MLRVFRFFMIVWALALVGLSACKEKTCTPGATQQCACPSGQGAQTCAEDGSKWEACTCAGAASPAGTTTAAPTIVIKPKGAGAGAPCRRQADCGADLECCAENGVATCIPQKLPASACGGFTPCVTKADCATNQACESAGALSKCVNRACKTFADCTAGFYCFTDANGSNCVPRKGIGQPCAERGTKPVDCKEGLMCSGLIGLTCNKLP